jgi:hypothetical protein
MRNLENEEGGLPYHVPRPIDPDEAHDVLYPTSPLNERPDPNNDEPLLPPLMDS